jgi:hypothetical protein
MLKNVLQNFVITLIAGMKCGFIKPGARSNAIIKTAEEEVSSLKHKDVVILWGGSDDIVRNNTKEALKNLSNFMNSNKNVNTVLINPPPRHDHMP